jgi:hypothetical protein
MVTRSDLTVEAGDARRVQTPVQTSSERLRSVKGPILSRSRQRPG